MRWIFRLNVSNEGSSIHLIFLLEGQHLLSSSAIHQPQSKHQLIQCRPQSPRPAAAMCESKAPQKIFPLCTHDPTSHQLSHSQKCLAGASKPRHLPPPRPSSPQKLCNRLPYLHAHSVTPKAFLHPGLSSHLSPSPFLQR